jgi:tetratricopeptide (TPR) repeat protein
MRKLTAVLILLLCATAPACGSFYAGMVEEDAYLSASSLFEKKDYHAAAKEFASFLEKFPDSKYKAASLLRMAELSENAADAMKYYNTVINGFPGTESEAEAVYDLAKLFYAQGDYKKARVYFNIVITKFPSMVWVEGSYYMLMLCAAAEGDAVIFEKAYDEYNARGFFTFKTRADLAYAGHMFDSGKFDKALVLYRGLIDKTQGKDKNIYMPLVYRNAAEAAKKTGDVSGAEMLESDLKFKYPGSAGPNEEAVKAAPSGDGKADLEQPAIMPAGKQRHKTVQKEGPRGFYTVQIGAYTNKRFCDQTAEKLSGKKYEVFVKKSGKFYKLSVGRFETRQDAEDFAPGLAKKEKLKSYLVKQGWE